MTDSPVWHPFTQHGTEPPPPRALHAEGALIHTDRSPLIDAISSWWVITHGHRHPPIMQAIHDAAERLDQVIFAGLTHDPAEDLARALVDLAPAGLTRVFYSDSGSTSVEVALKMALGFWKNSGRPRHRIAVLDHSYHGDTIGTMSVGARGIFNAAYEPLMFAVDRLPFPVDGGSQTLAALERGEGSEGDLDLLLDQCDNILGRSFCALGDGATSPITSSVEHFRQEFLDHLSHGGCPFDPAASAVFATREGATS